MTDLRKAVADEFDAMYQQRPEGWVEEQRDRNRVIDWRLAYDMKRAAQTFHLNRYQEDAGISAAILNLRYALKKLEAELYDQMRGREHE